MSPIPQSLLILSCSERKRCDMGLLPAIERYDGPAFRVLRRFLKENPSEQLDIYILSANFGLIPGNHPIPNYDQRMTPQRFRELHPQVIAALNEIFFNRIYQSLYICVGNDYLHVLDGYDRLISPELSVLVATGPQGKKLAELYDWLYGPSSTRLQKSQTVITNGKAHLRGIEVSITPAQVLAKARRALKEGEGDPANYQSWYVLIDERRVSPKWLVSQLTGLPVSAFQAREARNVLQHLGIGVHHV